MAKFYGAVGYAVNTEAAPGVFRDVMTERAYYGEVVQNIRRLRDGDGLNDNVNLQNIIRIVADGYALQNFLTIRYLRWMGVLWKVDSVDVQRPRLLLRLGEVYNGPTDPTPVGT